MDVEYEWSPVCTKREALRNCISVDVVIRVVWFSWCVLGNSDTTVDMFSSHSFPLKKKWWKDFAVGFTQDPFHSLFCVDIGVSVLDATWKENIWNPFLVQKVLLKDLIDLCRPSVLKYSYFALWFCMQDLSISPSTVNVPIIHNSHILSLWRRLWLSQPDLLDVVQINLCNPQQTHVVVRHSHVMYWLI